MNNNPWFRMYNDFIFDEVVEFLAFEDQRHFVFLLCMKNLGLLDKEYPKFGMLDSVVGRRLGLFGEALTNAKVRLMDVGLIDENWQPTGWDKRQFISDTDPTHAERQRKYRERQKSKRNGDVTRDVTVTVLDTDTDTDTEKPNTSCDNSDELSPEPVANKPKLKPIPYQEIVALYHQHMPMCPVAAQLTTKRKGQISARWNSGVLPDLENWSEYFKYCAQSKFLTGQVDPANGRKRFIADIEWLTNETNFTKVWEGKYHG